MPRKIIKEDKVKEEKTVIKQNSSYYEAVGRRKVAVARVRLYVTSDEVRFKDKTVKLGDIIVNMIPIAQYFPGEIYKKLYREPFQITSTEGRFAVSALISGGGLSGQVGAFRLGVARALEKLDKEKYRPILKKGGFLTRDPRAKERRKAGLAQKARARKQSPKR